MKWFRIFVSTVTIFVGCAHTQPGTYVELVDKEGTSVYVAGAAAPGMDQSIACAGAVGRAVAAIALKFAQKNRGAGDEVAKAVGAESGEVFLQKYAKMTAQDSAVHDVSFDPGQHLCMATVRWTPPIFVKDALLKFAEKLKRAETGGPQAAPAAPAPAAPGSSPAPAPATAAPPPAPGASAAPPPPAPIAAPVSALAAPAAGPEIPACTAERAKFKHANAGGKRALDDFNECLRRTSGDAGICSRYKMYVDEAKTKLQSGAQPLVDCLNGSLALGLRQALAKDLPGHAGVFIENRGDGTASVWAFSPTADTAFAIEIAPDGTVAKRVPLDAGQVQWLRGRLGS